MKLHPKYKFTAPIHIFPQQFRFAIQTTSFRHVPQQILASAQKYISFSAEDKCFHIYIYSVLCVIFSLISLYN